MKKLTLSIILVLLSTHFMSAQQDPHFSLYKYNMSILNPAYAGTSGFSEVGLNLRTQWVNIPGSPETQTLNFNTPMRNNVGLGLNIIQDKVHVLKETHLYADFSYRLEMTDNTDLFLGLKAGGSFLEVDLLSLGITNDPLFSENVNVFNPNVGVGAYLKGKKYFISLSAPALLQNDRYEREGVEPVEANDRIHYFTSAGYTFNVADNFDLTPSFLLKAATGAPISLDMTLTGTLYEDIDLVLNYRNDESITGMFRLKLFDWMKLGYAYEYTVSDIRTEFNDGTHEIMLSFSLGKY